jgi:formiminotetrahydrofolate cyclodeaminase
MARTRRSLDERIEEQEQVVSKAKEHYESEVNKLEQLMNKRDEFQKKELMKAIEDSDRSFEEIMQFLQCDTSSENSEDVES